MRLSIRPKLLLVFLGAGVLAVGLTALALLSVGLLTIPSDQIGVRYNVLTVARNLDAGAKAVQDVLEAGGDREAVRWAALSVDLPEGFRTRVVAMDGTVWVDSHGTDGRQAAAAEIMEWYTRTVGTEPTIAATPYPLQVNGKLWGFYTVALPEELAGGLTSGSPGPLGSRVLLLFLGGPLLALVASLLVFWFFGLHLIRPVRRVQAVLSRIAAGDLSARANLGKRGDELGQLARDVDTMAQRLQEANAAALASNQSRRYLVAAASHDLRSPLTALLAHVEALRLGAADDPAQSVAMIEEKGLQLKRLIDDLFELAALDAQQERWQTVRRDVAELVRRAVIGQLPELEAAGFTVEADLPEEPLWANIAQGKLERVLDNLLANARKYGAEGRWLGARAWLTPAGRIRVEVSDRGPGIIESEQQQIFERFYRSDSARGAGGSGLGLAIAREILSRHGGETGVTNRPEGGSCFWFELPAAM